MKANQKLRVVVDQVSFYTTVKQVRLGVGDSYKVNDAVRFMLNSLIDRRDWYRQTGKANHQVTGHAGVTPNGLNVQIDVV